MRALTFAAGEGSRAQSTTSGANLDYVIPCCPESAAPRRFDKWCGPKRLVQARLSNVPALRLQQRGRHVRRTARPFGHLSFSILHSAKLYALGAV